MKITYLVNERQADGSLVLVETTSAHWHRIVAANKTAPANERRYFYADILSDNYNLDCIVMEVSKEQHAAWNSERRSARRNRDAAKGDLYHTHQPGAWQIGWKPRQFLIYSLLHSAYMLRHPKQEVRQIKARYHTLAGKLASAFMWL